MSTARIINGYKNKEPTQNVECSLKRNLPKSVPGLNAALGNPLDALHRRPRFRSEVSDFKFAPFLTTNFSAWKWTFYGCARKACVIIRAPFPVSAVIWVGFACDRLWAYRMRFGSERHRKMLIRGVCPLYRWTGKMICGTLSNNSAGNANGWNRHAHK